MSEAEIAWAAALFEGEGSFSVRPRGNRPTVQMQLGMTDLDVIQRFHAIVGLGYLDPVLIRPGVKPMYRWRLNKRADIIRLVTLLLPWLGERRTAKAQEILALPPPGSELHCVHGHLFDEANTYIRRDRNGWKHRACRICAALYQRRLRASRKARLAA